MVRLFSSWHRARAASLLAVLLALMVWSPWRGQAQSPITAPAFRQGGGHLDMTPFQVPFKPGPFGPDGKVHRVPSQEAVVHPEGEFELAKESKARAAAGHADLTTKPFVNVLSTAEMKALKWSPAELQVPGSHSRATIPQNSSAAASSPASNSSAFPGIPYNGNVPPDGALAAGHIDVVEVVNAEIGVYDKSGVLLSVQNLSDLFAPVGTPAQDHIFDPRAVYDPDSQRFFVLATSQSDSPHRSNYLLAVSNADDVSLGWRVFAFDASINGSNATDNWCDYPQLGIDSVAIYMSCNMYVHPFGTSNFQYVKIRIMTKDELVNGPCCSWWDFWDLREGLFGAFKSTSVAPAVMHFSRDTDGDFWIDAAGQGGSDSTLHIWQLTNAANCCNGSSTGPNLDGTHDDGVGSYGAAPDAVQPNGAAALDTPDTRVLYATWEFGHLSVGQTIACDQGGTTSACAAFTEINTTAYPNLSNVNDWVWGGGTGENVYYPRTEQNANADKTMVYTRSDAASTFPGAFSVNIPNSNVCTNCIGTETTLQAGNGTYVHLDNNVNRWGDYMGAAADPDLLGIWVDGEYAEGLAADWNTQILATYNTYAAADLPSPASLDFGTQVEYTESSPQTVTFTSVGSVPLSIGLVNISGDKDFFIQQLNTCNGATLQNGNSCQVNVAFSPTVAGPGNASLNIPDNTPARMTTVSLSGTGTRAATSISVVSSLNPSTLGQVVTFTATVFSPTSTATGTVTFQDGATVLGTTKVSSSTAGFSISALGGGLHSITATYSGDANFLSSSSPVLSQVVTAATATSVVSSLNPSVFGQSVTFTSRVTSPGGTPTGRVSFQDGASLLGTASLSGGTARFTTSALTGGAHSIQAVYGGSVGFVASTSGVLPQSVNKASTATTVVSSVNPSSFRETINLTATVKPQFGGTVGGTVVFKDGAATLATVAITRNQASFTTSALHVGNHSITATYTGNGNLHGSASAALAQAVKKATTTTFLVSTPNPSKHGQTVTFTGTVMPAFSGTPTGTMVFRDNTTATVLGTAAVGSNGKAVLSTANLVVGMHSITAQYGGDVDFAASTSKPLNQVVNK